MLALCRVIFHDITVLITSSFQNKTKTVANPKPPVPKQIQLLFDNMAHIGLFHLAVTPTFVRSTGRMAVFSALLSRIQNCYQLYRVSTTPILLLGSSPMSGSLCTCTITGFKHFAATLVRFDEQSNHYCNHGLELDDIKYCEKVHKIHGLDDSKYCEKVHKI